MANEDDYMSDIFIQATTAHESCLNTQRTVLRKRKLDKNKSDCDFKNKVKPKHVYEKEQREKGLATSISGDNLGFKLMEKMGYKKGEGLGKLGKGRFEPIPIEVKKNRFGLGKESSDKAKINVRKQLLEIVAEKKLKLEKIQRNDFRTRMSQKYSCHQTERDLSKSQNACLQLDSGEEIQEPLYEFFWPTQMLPETLDEVDDDSDKYSSDEKLAMITSYLRQQYLYCIWCASKFDDIEDMMKNCPGDNADAHDD